MLDASTTNAYFNSVNALVTDITTDQNLISKPHRYYIIGNEPDKWGGYSSINNKFYDLGNNAVDISIIARYTKTIATWIRAIDASAIIIGPELAWHHFDASAPDMFNALCDITNLPNNIFVSSPSDPGYVDIGSFHSYNWPKDDQSTPGWQSLPWVKQDVIDYPRVQGAGSLFNQLSAMLNWLSANGRAYDGFLAITEFNLAWENESANGQQDESCNSFIAGQYLAECLGIGRFYDWGWNSKMFGIWPWSVQEGSGTGDLGMFDQSSVERSTYFHLQMTAKEFSRGRVQVLSNVSTTDQVKAFGVRDCDGGAVMILNQGSTAQSYYYSLNQSAPIPYDVGGNIDMQWDAYVTSDVSILSNALGDIQPLETHVLRLNSCGEIIYTYKYSDADYIADQPPAESPHAGTGCTCSRTLPYEWYEMDPELNPERVAYSDATSLPETTKNYLQLYPNPADESFIVKFETGNSAVLTIYSNVGVKVHQEGLEVGNSFHKVSVSNLIPGLYNCVIQTDNSKYTGRIIIHH